MGAADLLPHLLGFAAPAAFLAFLVPTLARGAFRRQAGLAWWAQVAALFLVGLVVLAAGLWGFGRDGKMATYGALVAAMATAQWFTMRAWK